jgi:dihydrofolate synthase/folylpolyglutamate synthase
MTERISLDGDEVSEDVFVRAYAEVDPYLPVVERTTQHPVSFFETITAMAYAAFADAPVDVAVVEVGLGGAWDATSVADAQVSVVTPIAVDHASLLGETPGEIAVEKAGIIKPGSFAVLAQQRPEVLDVMGARAADVGAQMAVEGQQFAVVTRVPGVGGQLLTLQGLAAEYTEVFLPLHGAHQAQNAAVALAAVEAFVGGIELDADVVRGAFAEASSPGRLEVVRRSPVVLLDAAHNPAGAEALVAAVTEAFTLSPLVGVVSVMADKEVEAILAILEPVMAEIVCTQNSQRRAMPADELGDIAEGIFGSDRVHVHRRLDDALDVAAGLAEQGGSQGEAIGSGGVLVTGSVITVGEARGLLGGLR